MTYSREAAAAGDERLRNNFRGRSSIRRKSRLAGKGREFIKRLVVTTNTYTTTRVCGVKARWSMPMGREGGGEVRFQPSKTSRVSRLRILLRNRARLVLSRLMKLPGALYGQQRVTGFRIHRSIRISIIYRPLIW